MGGKRPTIPFKNDLKITEQNLRWSVAGSTVHYFDRRRWTRIVTHYLSSDGLGDGPSQVGRSVNLSITPYLEGCLTAFAATVKAMLKALGINNILGFDWPASPSAESMIRALEVLYSLGVLDDDGKLECIQSQWDVQDCQNFSRSLYSSFICAVQQLSRKVEGALSQGMEQLQQSLAETLANGSPATDGSSGDVANYMGQVAMSIGKHDTLDGFLHQADKLRQQTSQQMNHNLTTRQSARALLVTNEYFSSLRALSSLLFSRPREQ
ncbi:Transcription factor HBP-1b(c38) [Capsicum chinense]|nr:Transcription factor HBP-1b(c38) [Capsicum chinense]